MLSAPPGVSLVYNFFVVIFFFFLRRIKKSIFLIRVIMMPIQVLKESSHDIFNDLQSSYFTGKDVATQVESRMAVQWYF